MFVFYWSKILDGTEVIKKEFTEGWCAFSIAFDTEGDFQEAVPKMILMCLNIVSNTRKYDTQRGIKCSPAIIINAGNTSDPLEGLPYVGIKWEEIKYAPIT